MGRDQFYFPIAPKPDQKNDKNKDRRVYYDAVPMYPGASVIKGANMNLDEARYAVLHGQDVWTPLENDAIALCVYASGRYVSGNNEASVLSGDNAFHYHLKGKIDGVHVFFGGQAIMMCDWS